MAGFSERCGSLIGLCTVGAGGETTLRCGEKDSGRETGLEIKGAGGPIDNMLESSWQRSKAAWQRN
jgi:hypothetical protein